MSIDSKKLLLLEKNEAVIQKKFIAQFVEIQSRTSLYPDILFINAHTTGIRTGRDKLNRMIRAHEERLMGSIKGMPDLEIFIRGGEVIFIELKSPNAYFTKTGKVSKNMGLSTEQQSLKTVFEENGFKYFVCYSVDHIFKTLDNLGLC